MTHNRKKDIAVIGLSGTFPKSSDINEFWENLIQGNELVEFLDSDKQDKSLIDNPNYVPAISRVYNEDKFDYNFFGYTKEEAKYMDPQIRVMHQLVYQALDNAGYNFSENQIVGLYLSASDNLNWRVFEMLYPGGTASKFLTDKYANKEFISTLISYKLGLKGPSLYIDSACSSSLSSIHIACRSLLLKECEIAVAGGVSIRSVESKGYLFEEGMITSRDGHCRAFDENSSGTIWGEGAGAVVLKRYEDAIRDKDHIYAVVRSTFLNNDGKRKVGYAAPSVLGQTECIKTSLLIAGLKPNEINYIESHGTATKIGDPIELAALNEAFEFDNNSKCLIGSVKSNMGHLDAAAGIAGFIKTCLILKSRQIPPSINFDKPNPDIEFHKGPFQVNTQLTKWNEEGVFRAGVSSFGIGGTNCHAILEEHPVEVEAHGKSRNVFFLSAKTEKSLKLYKEALFNHITQSEGRNLEQMSYSVNQKTSATYPYRDFIVLNNKDNVSIPYNLNRKNVSQIGLKNIVFLFPGQGSQYFKMGKELYDNLEVFKETMDQGFKILHDISGIDYREILGYNNDSNQGQENINNTKYTQPLLFLIEYVIAKTIISFGILPTSMIGHSLGEYVAACIADVITFEDALKIVVKRADLMSSVKSGVMFAISETREKIEHLIDCQYSVAAINTNKSCVIGCDENSKSIIQNKLEDNNIGFTILKTSHAFHSFMMDDILDAFREELMKINFSLPKIPIVSNLTGNFWNNHEEITAEYWVKHLRNTVLFDKGMNQILENGSNSIFIEVGPGRALLNFINEISNKEVQAVALLNNRLGKTNDYEQLLNNLGLLWEIGCNVKFEKIYTQKWYKIPMPTYFFDEDSFPSRVNPLEMLNPQLNSYKSIVSGDLDTLLQDQNIEVELFQDDNTEVSNDKAFRLRLSTEYAEPVNETQRRLVTIWKSFLGNKLIGIKDSFLEIGGDSLKAISIVNSINKEFHFELTFQEFYEEGITIELLSQKIDLVSKLKNITNTEAKTKKIKI